MFFEHTSYSYLFVYKVVGIFAVEAKSSCHKLKVASDLINFIKNSGVLEEIVLSQLTPNVSVLKNSMI